MWIKPVIREVSEMNGVKVLDCKCGNRPKLSYQGEPGSYKLFCEKCGRELSQRGSNSRSLKKLAEIWNEGKCDDDFKTSEEEAKEIMALLMDYVPCGEDPIPKYDSSDGPDLYDEDAGNLES